MAVRGRPTSAVATSFSSTDVWQTITWIPCWNQTMDQNQSSMILATSMITRPSLTNRVPNQRKREATLDSAINDAQEDRLRSIIRTLARAQPAARTFIEQSLIAPLVGSDSKKRKRYDVCGNCGAEYTTDEIVIGSCDFFHPGESGVAKPCMFLLTCWQASWTRTWSMKASLFWRTPGMIQWTFQTRRKLQKLSFGRAATSMETRRAALNRDMCPRASTKSSLLGIEAPWQTKSPTIDQLPIGNCDNNGSMDCQLADETKLFVSIASDRGNGPASQNVFERRHNLASILWSF